MTSARVVHDHLPLEPLEIAVFPRKRSLDASDLTVDVTNLDGSGPRDRPLGVRLPPAPVVARPRERFGVRANIPMTHAGILAPCARVLKVLSLAVEDSQEEVRRCDSWSGCGRGFGTRMRRSGGTSWRGPTGSRGSGSDATHRVMVSSVTDPHGLVDVAELAALAGVKQSTLRSYLARGYTPRPVAHYGSSPVWDRRTAEAWARTRPRYTP